MLVLTVLMALAIIATPFVLSMLEQEKTAAVGRSERQADYGAEGARNFAIAHLVRGTEGFERHAPTGIHNTPYQDTPDEFQIDLRDARLKALRIADPRGRIWGASAQDEQGKINTLSAPSRVLDTLRSLVDVRIADVKDYVTIYSSRPSRWGCARRIRDVNTFSTPAGSIEGLLLDDAIHYGKGATVRVSKPGLPVLETEVDQHGYTLQYGLEVIRTVAAVDAGYAGGVVELELRHPVNLNTARRETLTAVFEGITVTWPTGRWYRLTRHDAQEIAETLLAQPIDSWFEFTQTILNLGLDDLGKGAAIVHAIDPTNALFGGTGTLPLCFTSEETATVEAFASINTPAGTPLSVVGFREVIDLGAPVTMTRYFESQYDFDRMMGPPRLLPPGLPSPPADTAQTLQFLGFPHKLDGFPYGHDMASLPVLVQSGEPSDRTLKPQPLDREAYVQLRPAEDRRGASSLLFTINHFAPELEGLKLADAPYLQNWNEVFMRRPPRPGTPASASPSVAAGGIEFWIRFDGAAPKRGRLFDVRETETSNRISLEIEHPDVVYRISDASQGSPNIVLDNGWAEIRAPNTFLPDTWYHIGLYWQGTRYGQMLLLTDGFVPPGARWRLVDEDESTSPSTELSAPMPPPSDPAVPTTSVSLRDSSWMTKPSNWPSPEPWHMPLLIGGEVVEYFPEVGQGLRGARGTRVQDHPQDAKVTLFGYASRLRALDVQFTYPSGTLALSYSDLRATKGKLVVPFGASTEATLVGTDDDGNGNPILKAGTATLRFDSPDVTQWPDRGYIRIRDEAISYRAIDRNAKAFKGCQRGAEGTQAVDHPNGVPIELWSVAVDVLDASMPEPAIVQFGPEWFGPVKKAQNSGGTYWVGCVTGGVAVPLGRGSAFGTSQSAHVTGEPVVPTFAVRESDPALTRFNCQRHDVVTVIDADNYREQHRIANSWTGSATPQGTVFSDPTMQVVALQEPVRRDFKRDDLHARVLKWPSGETLGVRWLELAGPRTAIGPFQATLDELKNIASDGGGVQVAAPVDPSAPHLQVSSTASLGLDTRRPAGAVLCGEEVIGFARFRATQHLTGCARGWLNSCPLVHNSGDEVFHLSFLPVSALAQAAQPEDRVLRLRQPPVGQGIPSGYLLIDQEVVGYWLGRGPDGWEADTLPTFEGRGLFRGRFGTPPAGHAMDAMAYAIPYRYADGFRLHEFDDRMPHFQVAHTLRGATWHRLSFDYDVPTGDPLVTVHAFVRADGLGDLWQPEVGDQSAVWHFTDGTSNVLDYVSSRLDAGQIEARFFVGYRPGAYWPAHAWKRTARLKEVRIDYTRETRVLFHEDH
ncbi:MAG: hypothetical protein HY716_03935 [Planctomycetes bacterium]|nr:hypothetical protein [Planctomycetota bacterium]